jgi:hypothetical protein
MRRTKWTQVFVAPEAVIFHTPEQLQRFVTEEIRRAFVLNQIPRSPR